MKFKWNAVAFGVLVWASCLASAAIARLAQGEAVGFALFFLPPIFGLAAVGAVLFGEMP